ncbi:MAG: hypothetical protein MUP85_22040 [Candidatus Lokiarchaeota archaeon]|nr:hypothetical protein [Candidatus Lokiarchaeota archaeon]
MTPWYITEEEYSGMHDQTMRGEHCAVLCEQGRCLSNCNTYEIYKNKYFEGEMYRSYGYI